MRPIVLALAGALAITACGGGDDELSAEEYRERANELCVEAEREVEELDLPNSPEELADWLEELVDRSRPYDRDFRELDPPERFEELHRKAVRLSNRFEEQFERLIERLRAAEHPELALQREFEQLLPQIRRSDELNRRLGLDECLEPLLDEPPSNTS